MYNYQIEPEVVTGFYTLITVASLDEVRAYNLQAKEEAQTNPDDTDQGDDTSEGEGD